jgi:hypothetical protein
MSRLVKTEALGKSANQDLVAPLPPTPRQYLVIVLKAVWHTASNLRDLRDYIALAVEVLAVAGIVVGALKVSWIWLPIGAAAIAFVGLVRGGYSAWRDEVLRAIAAQAQANELRTAAEQAVRRDPDLQLRIEYQQRDAKSTLFIRCRNESAQEIVDLSARVIGEAVWLKGDWKERPVADADLLKFDGDGRFTRIGAGSQKEIYVASLSTSKEATLWRFRAGPTKTSDMTVGPRDPTASLHYVLSDVKLMAGRYRLTIAFEAPARRTQEEWLCFSFNPSGRGAVPRGLNWIDPTTSS